PHSCTVCVCATGSHFAASQCSSSHCVDLSSSFVWSTWFFCSTSSPYSWLVLSTALPSSVTCRVPPQLNPL
ncbi:hypothetical protein TSMEX_006313, partial [Taenia solium]